MTKQTTETWMLAACDPWTHPEPPNAVLSADELSAALAMAQQHAVLGAALRSVGTWTIEQGARHEQDRARCAAIIRQFSDQHLLNVGFTLGLRQVADRAIRALVDAGIPCSLLKGEDFAERLYPISSLRPYRDVDLLVPTDAYGDADRVLQSLGFAPHLPERKHAAADYGQISYFDEGVERWSVELHWNVINSPAQRRRCSLTWDDMEFLPSGGVSGQRQLAPTSLLILAAVHACVGHRFDSLQQLCDIRQICRAAAGEIDVERLTDSCRRSNCQTPILWSLGVLTRVLSCTAAADLLARCRFTSRATQRFGILGRRTILQPQSITSRLRRSVARWRLATAA